jgi:PAS domain S-box-containing protein
VRLRNNVRDAMRTIAIWKQLPRVSVILTTLFVSTASAQDAQPQRDLGMVSTFLLVLSLSVVVAYLLYERTQRRREALRMSDNDDQLRFLFEKNRDGLVITDDEGRFIRTNAAAAELLGYTVDEMLGINVYDLQSAEPPDTRTRYHAYLEAGFRTGEWSFFRPDGEIRTIRYTTTKYSPGLHLSIVRDETQTKRAEEALRESESRYRQMFEQNRAVQLLLDPTNGQIVDANPAASEFYGYGSDQLRQMKITEITMQPSDEIARRLQQTADGEGYFFLSRHRLASGAIRDVEVHSSPLHLSDRTLLYSIVNDVTELRRNEERFRRFFELPLVGMAVTSPERRFLIANKRLCDMLGYSEEEIINREWTTVTHEEDIAENLALLDETIRGETEGYRMEKRFVHRDGHTVYASISSRSVRRDDGSVDYLVLIVEDITERKEAEIALRDSEERFRQLAENIDAVFFMSEGVDRVEPQRVIYVSPAYEKIWGLSRERLYRQQRSWFEGVHPDDRDRIAASFPKIAIGEFNEQFRVLRPDGEIRWVHDRVFPVYDDLGQVYRIAGIVEDITDRKIVETRLNQLNVELEERVIARTADLETKSREMESFAYSVAHDLKAPLRGIDGYTRLLLARHSSEIEEEGRKLLIKVRSAIQQMNQLIEDLLDYSRIERRTISTFRVDLRALVHAVVDEMTHDLQGHDLQLVFKVDCDTVFADTEALMQALRNLLDNAVKFSGNVAKPRIEIGAQDLGEACRIWVRDNGIGLDPKFRDRIFELFQRLHDSEEYAGTGVGLALVRKAMSRMGGKVWVESTPGEGATFFLELPHQFDLVTTATA